MRRATRDEEHKSRASSFSLYSGPTLKSFTTLAFSGRFG
jgi:hypothetical protein